MDHEAPLSPIFHDSVISKLNPQLLHYSKSESEKENSLWKFQKNSRVLMESFELGARQQPQVKE